MTFSLNIFLSFISAFCITYLVIPKVITFAKRFRLLDAPGKRAAHQQAVPIFGGIAIFAGLMGSLLFWADIGNIQFILISFFIVFCVGIVDDLLSLSPVKKLVGQIASILVVIFFHKLEISSMHGVLAVYELPAWISILFTIFVVIVITNGFNLIDGINGLAGGLGVIASFGFGFVAALMNQQDMAIIAFALSGTLIAFLRYNFLPLRAKVFMGDTGSLVVGMVLSVLALNTIEHGLVTESIHLPNKGPLLAIVILAIPLFDSLRVFVARVIVGRHPLHPGKGHIHHALLDLGMGHKYASIILWVVAIMLMILSYFLLEININRGIAILAVVSFVLLLIPFYILRKNP